MMFSCYTMSEMKYRQSELRLMYIISDYVSFSSEDAASLVECVSHVL